MMSDARLLSQYASDQDADAFAQLVEKYSGLVYGVCLRVTGSRHDAEDAAQECFLSLARHAGNVRSSLPGWLHTTARRAALDAVRHGPRAQEWKEAAVNAERDGASVRWSDIEPHVDAAIEDLRDDLKSAVILHYLQGKSQAEVAEQLGCDRTTVSRRLQRGVEQLRRRLSKAGVTVSVAALALCLGAAPAYAAPSVLLASLGKIAVAGPTATVSVAAAGGVAAMKVAGLAVAAAALITVGVLTLAPSPSVPPAPTEEAAVKAPARGGPAGFIDGLSKESAPPATQPAGSLKVDLKVDRFKEGVEVDIWVVNTSSKAIVLEETYLPSWGVYWWFDFALDGSPVRAASLGSYTGHPIRNRVQHLPVRTLEPAQRLRWGSVLVCSSRSQIKGHDGYTPFVVAPAGRHTLTVSPRPEAWGRTGIEGTVSATADIAVNPRPPATASGDAVAWSTPVKGLRMRVRLEDGRFEPGKRSVFNIEFQNISDKPLRILKPAMSWGLSRHCFDAAGQRLRGMAMDGEYIAAARITVPAERTVVIAPGGTLRTTHGEHMGDEKVASVRFEYATPGNQPHLEHYWHGSLKAECALQWPNARSTALADAAWAKPVKGLRMRARLKDGRYEHAAPTVFVLELQNVSDKPLRVLKNPKNRRDLNRALIDAAGKVIREPQSDGVQPTRMPISPDMTVLLAPGARHQFTYSEELAEPGIAKVRFSFRPVRPLKDDDPELAGYWHARLRDGVLRAECVLPANRGAGQQGPKAPGAGGTMADISDCKVMLGGKPLAGKKVMVALRDRLFVNQYQIYPNPPSRIASPESTYKHAVSVEVSRTYRALRQQGLDQASAERRLAAFVRGLPNVAEVQAAGGATLMVWFSFGPDPKRRQLQGCPFDHSARALRAPVPGRSSEVDKRHAEILRALRSGATLAIGGQPRYELTEKK